jgi:hypothetical protein
MSLDTLFTEAADAGGPPTFDEDDIARRVQVRHRRRRRVATVGAALVVLAGAGAGLALAAAGGSDDVQTTEPPPIDQGIPTVPVTADALVGTWVPVPADEPGTPPRRLHIDADGTFTSDSCNTSFGYWGVGSGLAYLHLEVSTLQLCGSTDRLTHASGVPTLYADGLLRFGDGDGFRRAGVEDVPDPDARRAPATTVVPLAEDELVGSWTELDGQARVTFADDGIADFSDCGSVATSWEVPPPREVNGMTLAEDLRWGHRRAVVESMCGATVTGWLGPTVLTDDGVLIMSAQHRTIFFHRAGEASTELADAELTGGLWVLAAERARDAGSAAWVELDDDGTYRASAPCGVTQGTWAAAGADGATLTVTQPSTEGCAVPDPTSAMTMASVRLAGDDLVATYEPVPCVDGCDTVAPEQVFRRFDDLPVATLDDLLGEWSTSLVVDVSEVSAPVDFVGASAVVLGTCELPYGFDSGELAIGTSDSRGCVRSGLAVLTGPPMAARLDGGVLYLRNTIDGAVQVLVRGLQTFHDTPADVNGG